MNCHGFDIVGDIGLKLYKTRGGMIELRADMKPESGHIGIVEALGIELGPVQLSPEEATKVREGYKALQLGQVHTAEEVHAEMMKLICQSD